VHFDVDQSADGDPVVGILSCASIANAAVVIPSERRYYQGTRRATVVRALLTLMASVVVLGGCTAANQQQAASTQETQRRYLCLQTAQKPGGYDEQVFATCMASWGYEKGQAVYVHR
jgi:hypothetical protein